MKKLKLILKTAIPVMMIALVIVASVNMTSTEKTTYAGSKLTRIATIYATSDMGTANAKGYSVAKFSGTKNGGIYVQLTDGTYWTFAGSYAIDYVE